MFFLKNYLFIKQIFSRKKSDLKNYYKKAFTTSLKNKCNQWMGWQDSNLRMTEPKSVGLPLAYTPN